ncbi:MAG: serine/threonine protein phosphatase [Allobaculum sp.]|nr:serine/threonine protein phosphatase [Allobaculum sp.]
MNRKPVVQTLPSFSGRTLVISDIHGSLDLYQDLLQKCHYIPGQDRLILLGDLVEKGEQNLELVHFLMEQAKTKHVYMTMGNCDFVAKNILYSYRLDYLREVLLARSNSLIHEMIQELGLPPLDSQTDMDVLAATLRKHYLKELAFLNDLPHVLATPTATFVHSGLIDEQTYAQDFRYIMANYHFGRQDHHFSKPVVVGHMPISEYCPTIACFNPLFNQEKNILFIDGGNQVKRAGQLNALIFWNDDFTFEHLRFESVDDLLRVSVKHTTHPSTPDPFFVTWADGKVDILEDHSKYVLAYSPALEREIEVDKAFLTQDGDSMRASNFTNYEMPLEKGEIVSVVNLWDDKAQIKKNGQLGWTYRSNLDIDPTLVSFDLR